MSRPLPTPPAASAALAAALVLVAALATPLAAADPPPPDLRLEQADGRRPAAAEAPPLRGREGSVVEVGYRLRNVGGSDAFAAVVEAWTALGRVGPPARLQPGPRAGATAHRTLRLPLARGMRELCIEARLQTVDAGDPGDPRPDDNRLCRRVEIEPAPDAAATATPRRRSR